MTPCLLDSDVFIRAKRDHYRFVVCPGFSDWLIQAHQEGKIYSIESVRDELLAASDELTIWAQSAPSLFFLPVDAEVAAAAATLSAWVVGQGYEQQSINTFFSAADYWLVAHAMAKGWRVVTHEQSAPLGKRIKIPDVCNGVGIESLTPFEMLEELGARFVL